MAPANPHPCPSPATLAARIASERRRLGLTQRGAAAVLGVSQSTYRDYESAAGLISLPTLFALVTGPGMDPRALLPELFAVADSQVGNSHR